MSKRYEFKYHANCDHFDFWDNETGKELGEGDLIEILNKQDEQIRSLEEQLKDAKPKKPKYKLKQVVYAPVDKDTILMGEIDVYDYYTNRYFVFFPAQGNPFDMGNEWCCESDLFATREEAEKRLDELKGK